MDAPTIQFAQARDGIRLAFWEAGDGPPLVWLDVPFFTHVGVETAISPTREFFEQIAESSHILRLDFRGSGASQRDVDRLDLDTLCSDVLDVADAAGFDRFALFGRDAAGAIAIKLASDYPQRLDALVLYGAWARGADLPVHPRLAAMERLLEVDWPMYTETVARVVMGVRDEQAAMVSRHLQHCVSAATWRLAAQAVQSFDVRSSIEHIQARTLVLYPGEGALAPLEQSEKLASSISGAQLRIIPGQQIPFGAQDETARVIAQFLGLARPHARRRGRGIRIILATDLEGHTEIISRLGDDRGRVVLRAHEGATRDCLRRNRGEEIKTMGDGFIASFPSAIDALNCALEIQTRVGDLPYRDLGLDAPLRIRLGITAGEPIEENADLFGASVIAAARIVSAANGGQTLVAEVVRQLAIGGGFEFRDAGERELKGLEEPIRLWELVEKRA